MGSELGMTGPDQDCVPRSTCHQWRPHPAIVQQFIDSELREGRMFGPFCTRWNPVPSTHKQIRGYWEEKPARKVPSNCRSIIPLRNECQWWYLTRALLNVIHKGGWRSARNLAIRCGLHAGQDRYKKCIQGSTRTPSGQTSPGNSLEREIVCWRSPSFWPQISSKNIYSFSWCPGVHYQAAWGWTPLALPRSLYYSRKAWLWGVCNKPWHNNGSLPHAWGTSNKTEGPASTTTFLGILLDTLHMEIRLPPAKLCRLKQVIDDWSSKSWYTKRDLESLIGLLQHASTIVKPGRSFLRQIIKLNKNPQRLIWLNQAFHSDLAWWRLCLKAWNGTSMLSTLAARDHDETITTDASESWGCGGFWQNHWFQQPWDSQEALASQCIATKEMLPILLSCAIWGKHWHGKYMQFQSDNEAVISALSTKSCKDTSLMHMLRCLFFFQAHHSFSYTARHIPGIDNTLTDALSRNNATLFLSKVPNADKTTTHVPQELMELLVIQKPDWTSQNWTTLFSTILNKV